MELYSINNFSNYSNDPVICSIEINNVHHNFELDSGAAVTAVSEKYYAAHFGKNRIVPDSTRLRGYGNEEIQVSGAIFPIVKFNDRLKEFKILIVKNGGPPIVGRDFMSSFGITLNVNNVSAFNPSIELNNLVTQYNCLFDDTIGLLRSTKVHLDIQPDAIPIFLKPRPIPHAFRVQVEKSISKLCKSNIITKINSSPWGTPLVPILKPDGSVRICADYKVTINKFLKDSNYPLPLISDLFAKLGGNTIFTKLDLKMAYNQIELDDESKLLATWSTHMGIFQMNRLPFGISPATGIFQREIEKVLIDIPGTSNYLDDIIVSAPNINEHRKTLKIVFERLKQAGLKLNKSKCVFAQSKIKYLGHEISGRGLSKLDTHKEAVIKAPAPKNVTQLRSFIGLVNYYGKFISNIAQKLHPLYNLLKENNKFIWSTDCEKSFTQIKQDVVSDVILVHFDPKRPIILTCDSSSYGIGAVLAHLFEDGSEKPIAFASRSLSKAELNYGMIQKEALAIIFATSKFFQYLIGNFFTLVTDHKPLIAIFGEHKGIPQMSASRLQRWAVHLSAFKYKIKYIKSKENCADMFSRLPLPQYIEEENNHKEVTYLNYVSEKPFLINYRNIQIETQKDPIISKVIQAINDNTLHKSKNSLFKNYTQKADELYIEQNILLWGYRVVIPSSLRRTILHQLHETRLGIVKTKSICRSYFWWPKVDKDIEDLIKACPSCLHTLPSPPKSPVIPWEIPTKPWSRIHVDFAGPFKNLYFLIILDAYAKWPEVFILKQITTQTTIGKLRETFSRFGILKTIVSDNGRQFTLHIFKQFTDYLNIRHVFTAPGHPATNGAAENSVKTIKNALKAATFSKQISIEIALNNFLFDYRIAVHNTTNIAPAELMFGRSLRTKLDLLKPTPKDNSNKVLIPIQKRKFNINDNVMIRNYSNPNEDRWEPAIISNVLGPRTYICLTKNSKTIKRHIDQIRTRNIDNTKVPIKISIIQIFFRK